MFIDCKIEFLSIRKKKLDIWTTGLLCIIYYIQLLPVAPLYGDVQIRFADWVRQLPHYDMSKWTCTSESQEEKVTVAIQSRVETIRSEHVRFISELARYNNEVGLFHLCTLSLVA